MIIHSVGSPKEITFIFPYWQTVPEQECFQKLPFHEQSMLESPQEQSNDPSNWDTRSSQKFLPKITSIKHPITFAVNYKNDSSIMVERDNSIVFQQNSKEPQTKKKIIIGEQWKQRSW